jgi:hypothetical protein
MRRRRPLPVFAALALAAAGCGSSPAPDPHDDSLVEQRAQAVAGERAAIDEVVSAAGGRVLGRGSSDICYEGQHNWEVDDPYDNRCTVQQVAAVALAGEFRPRIARMEQRLFASGWKRCPTCKRETLTRYLDEYWEYRVREATPAPPFAISQLPTPGTPYERGALGLTFDYGGRDLGGRFALESSHRIPSATTSQSYERTRTLDVDGVLAKARPDEHVVVVKVEDDYFEN